jgi:acyl-coenzyme A thioesterase PaaI-like protein
MSTPEMNTEALQQALAELFAPWVQALNLQVLACGVSQVTLRLPMSEQLTRVGGILCGQAMMAAADTAMALALMRHFGQFRPCSTVQLSSTFLKPLSGQDALVTAQVLRAGKSMAFGEIDLAGERDGQSVFRASTAYALM